MFPTPEEAEALLAEAEARNPGPWGDHSRTAGHCARCIAGACGLDPDKAYVLGLLHDIGRRFGKRHLGHVSDGFTYMQQLGYDEVARICLTHSFHSLSLSDYIGKTDTTPEEHALIETQLAQIRLDEYDHLIQLCDALAGAEGVMYMEERMLDVRRRYGSYPQDKWERNFQLLHHFQSKAGANIYLLTQKDSYSPKQRP